MNTIALLTDFGVQDNFVGVIKGVCLAVNPKARLIDISHAVRPQAVSQASFLLLNSFSFFPKGSVFLTVVDPGVGSSRGAVAIKTRNYYFVGPDNGVLSPAARRDGIKRIVSLSDKRYFLKEISSTFQGRDIFAPVAAHLSRGLSLSKLGKVKPDIKDLKFPLAKEEPGCIKAEVVYIDRFGNLVTNITKGQLKGFAKRGFSAAIKSKKIRKVYSFYSQARPGEVFFCQGSFGFLEISLNQKSAASFLKAKSGDRITIRKK